ncbi:MAG: hypothetical protein E6J43_08380 [Chloroflexi bacterium]|nr:MAG: hypothetical protein E6J43_08380 [Chloroflexota bacterium]
MNTQAPVAVRLLLDLAGLRLPAERESALKAMFEGSTRPIADALDRQDYSDSEPAARFRPPPSRPA